MPMPSSSTSIMARAVLAQLRMTIVPAPTFRENPCLMEFSTSGCRIMLGTIEVERVGAMSFRTFSLRPEPDDLDVEVLVDRLDLIAQRDEMILATEQPAQQPRELDDHRPRGLRFERISDETDVSVLKRKCGLIWLFSASMRAASSSFSCSSSRCSMRALFQILIGVATHSTAASSDEQHHHTALGAKLGARIEKAACAEAPPSV